MRRSDREIKEFNEIIEVIEKCDVCRLALNDKVYPYILPLNFGISVEDGQIMLYFHGATEGKKYDLIKQNNKASFEMDCSHKLVAKDGMCTMEYESVIGQGTIEFLSDHEKYEALCIIMKHYHKEDFPFNQNMISHTTVFKMKVASVKGKRRMTQQ